MHPTVQLTIPNSAEYFLRDPSLQLRGEELARVLRFSGTYESEHSVLWTDQIRVLLLPHGVDSQWFHDIHTVLGLAPVRYVSPRSRTGRLVHDLLHDGAAQLELREALQTYGTVRVQLVGPTPEIYQLTALIEGWGHDVQLECGGQESYWASLYLDSKTSVLDLARELGGLRVAPGITVHNMTELAGAVPVLLARYRKLIVRTAFGVAGDGSRVLSDAAGAVDEFLDTVAADSFFAFPILIQQFVAHEPEVGCPAADIFIDATGVAQVVPCAMTVENDYQFRSVTVGRDALPNSWRSKLETAAQQVGAAAHALGYRGWMCIDCVAGADGDLYITEINARRSGSLHAVGLLTTWSAVHELTITADFMIALQPGLDYT